ncbi:MULTISPECIES: RHS repeat-associated core domain-containing protein [unclassified Bradyrhizobium]|uniref:RHS repeat-associated core domain-containing protein n=1 Tax=unclassified Bradyrhizobium TaxID=2631580 RepID=UPI0028EB2695|nr:MULTISPECIES: RHS repeat-associated core domain-containing protein [unclassified Bradyrhizobium]
MIDMYLIRVVAIGSWGHMIRVGNRFAQLAWLRGSIVAVILFCASFIVCLAPQPVHAGHWASYHNGNCGSDGIACAQEDFWAYWSSDPSVILTKCYLNGAGSSGIFAGAICDGNSNGAYRGGVAFLNCDSGEVLTGSGCLAAPPADHCPSCRDQVANPVDLRSGMKIEAYTDFSTQSTSDGGASLKFERFYTSDQATLSGRLRPSRLGNGWRSNFDSGAIVASNSVTITLPNGEVVLFSYVSSTGLYAQSYYDWSLKSLVIGNRGRAATLVKNATTQLYTLTTDDNISRVYDAGGVLQSIIFQSGYTQALTYDSAGNNTLVTDSFGRTLQFTYTPQGLLDTMTVPGGQVYRYKFIPRYAIVGRSGPDPLQMAADLFALEYVIQPDTTADTADNPRIRYHYENASFPYALTGVTNEAGVRYATWTYDAKGRVLTSEHAGGVERYSIAYNDVANTVTVTNPLSKVAVYHYSKDARGNNILASIEGQPSANCVGSNSVIGYDVNNYVTDETDEEGRVTHYVRDSRGNPTLVTRGYGTPLAQSNSYTWHPTLNVPTRAVEPGVTTDFTWTGGLLTQLTKADTTSQTVPYATNGQTRTWTYGYTTGGLLASVDGPLPGAGDTVLYTYDQTGFVATITNEVGHLTKVMSHNGRGQPTTILDPNGVYTNLTYDPLGRLKSTIVDPSGLVATTSIDYTPTGDVSRIVRPNGAFLQYTYDDGRRLIRVQDNTGATVEYDRDNLGNVTARRIKDPSGILQASQTATYDELGRLLTFVGAFGQTWTHGYDRTHNEVSVTDPRANVFGSSFDGLNRLIGTTDEEGNSVAVARNGADDITAYSDPRSLTTSYVRNGFGEVIQRVSPDSGTTTYTYNVLGKPMQIVDARGVGTNLTYDNAGRLLAKQYPAAPSENITYTWDDATNGNKGKGRLTRIQDATGSIDWTFNALGQVMQERKATGSAIYVVGYGYDLAGNIIRMTYPSGRVVDYTRDTVGRITDVTSRTTNATVPLASNVTYGAAGPLQSLTYGNGLTLIKTYDQDYLLSQLVVTGTSSGTDVVNRQYSRNDGVNITDITDTVDTLRSENYSYTPTGRLENASGPWGVLGYAYDAVGNRMFESYASRGTVTEQITQYEATSNRLVDVSSNGTNVRTFTHDAAGNLVTDNRSGTIYGYRYNNRDRLDQLSLNSSVTADYGYDGLERMAVRTLRTASPPATMHYVYDLTGRLIAEATASGVVTREYVWLDDMPLAVAADLDTSAPNLWFVHADHLDRPIRMTDSTKNVVWNAYFLPFGAVDVILGSATNNLRFPGQYFLLEAGLHYNWYRHYDPTLGRYTQPDPNGEVPAFWSVTSGESPISSIIDGRGMSAQASAFVPSSLTVNWSFGLELPELLDGPNVYAYAGSAPALKRDHTGRYVDAMGIWYPGTDEEPGFDYNPLEHPYQTGGMMLAVVAMPYAGAICEYAVLGWEYSFGRNFRFAPYGNRTGHPLGRWPHYHRRAVDPVTGETMPGGGIGRHRPWETKSTDRSFWSRF